MPFKISLIRKCQLTLVLALSFAGIAPAANPKIESVSPPIGQRGTEFKVRLEGEGFSEATTLVFYSDEIQCVGTTLISDYELEATIRVGKSCPLQNQPFRVLAEHGFSDMRTIRVSPFTIVNEGADTKPDPELDLKQGVTLSGVLESGDIDQYQITLEKGQTLSAEVEAVRLGYELLDTVLSVSGPDGKTLVRCDDDPLFQQDPVISYILIIDR